jgi:hypothetical protein
MLAFKQLVSINFQGNVILFGRRADGQDSDIYYNVLGQGTQDNEPRLDWTGFSRLDFTRQVRQVGMSIITLAQDGTTLAPSTAPFRVVTDQKYISIVQQSLKGTLYVNRFRLLKSGSGANQKITSYSLAPAWEVRFARSGKEDVPADAADAQDFVGPGGAPFLEPALELSMIDGVAGGAFDVALLPMSGGTGFAWQFVVATAATSELRFYNFPATEDGLFAVAGKPIGADYEILPDARATIVSAGGGAALPLAGAPRLAVYVKHEKVVQPDGSSIGVKRAARAMLMAPVDTAQGRATAAIDAAIGTGGTLARIDGAVTAAPIVPAVFDLTFAAGAWLSLAPGTASPNPLALAGPFGFRFLIRPDALADGAQVIGGDGTAAPERAAPYVRIVDGDRLEVGFGTGSAAVACRTLHPAVPPGIWTEVAIDYRGAGDAPFTIRINDSAVPLTACTAPAEPCGTPVAAIGAAANGFAGALNLVAIEAAGVPILDLPCDTVDYGVSPPTTPNTAPSAVVATVFGAVNAPSTSPVNVDMSGTFHIDADGLTYYAGLADFIAPASDACLIDGADGLLHYYFKDAQGRFAVAQFATDAARATFASAWTTDWAAAPAALAATERGGTRYLGWEAQDWARVSARVLRAPDASQSGFLNFVAQRVGTYMTGTTITIAPSPVSPLLCDVTATAPDDVGTESWHGLPRSIDALSRIWNGAGSNSPDAQEVIDGRQPYFDYAGTNAAVLCPTTAPDSGSYFQFVSVPQLPLPLTAVTVAAGSAAGFVDVDIEIAPPPNWSGADPIRQHWPNVPAAPRSLADVFAGRATRYDYGAATTPGTRAYGLELTTARSDDQVPHLTLFVRDTLSPFTITIADGSTPQLCTVTICGFTLPDVDRRQDLFADVVNGTSASYPYPDNYVATVASAVFALQNGLAADLVNRAVPPADAGVLAYAGLVRVLFIGSAYDAPEIAPQPRTVAAPFQRARLSFNGTNTPLTGSLLFSAVIPDRPTDGRVGRVADTSSYSDGKASLVAPGVNGGWMPVAPSFSLGLNTSAKANQVSFNVAKPFMPSERLAIAGDLTAECWLNPVPATGRPHARALSYNVVGTADDPDLPLTWMLGSLRGPALVLGSSTSLTRGYNFAPPALTLQVYVKLPASGAKGRLLTVSEVRGPAQYAVLSIDQYGKARFSVLDNAGAVTTAAPLPTGKWICLTASVADAGPGQVALALYQDDAAPVVATAPTSFAGSLGQLTVGAVTNDAAPASLNGVAFWQRALSAEEVRDSVQQGFPDNDPQLGIRWNLTEGAGTLIANAAATGPEFDTSVVNPAANSWDAAGAFDVAYAGRDGLVLASNRIVRGWTHVALASRQGRAIALAGDAHGIITDGAPFNPGESLAIEAWVAPGRVNNRQMIVEKPGSFALFVDTLGQLVLQLTLSMPASAYDRTPIPFVHEIKTPIPAGQTSYVAVNFTTGAVDQASGSSQFVQPLYYVLSAIYVNGVKAAEKNKLDYPNPITVENRKSSFFLGMSEDRTFDYEGLISHVRIWSRTLGQDEIAGVYAFRGLPANRDGLVAGWNFAETSGTVAADLTGQHDLHLTSNQLWRIWQDVAEASIHVDGSPSLPRRLQPADLGGYGDVQFTIGGVVSGGALAEPFAGEIDDVRLFSTLLTGQQIAASMNRPLTGREPALAGYWSVNVGSGGTLFDDTGRGNNGALQPPTAPPVWRASSAPIQNEGELVVNAIGGTAGYQVADIADQPAVAEFASAELDAYGQLYSVMKRGYFCLTTAGTNQLDTDFKVGDLDTIYVGQVQTRPVIIGYIEGGPPLPSENQTLAYWSGADGGPTAEYATATSVTYVESNSVVRTFSGAQSSTFEGEFNLKGGLYQKSKTAVSVGVGAESETQVLETVIKGGLKTALSGDLGGTDEVEQSHSSDVRLTTSMTPAGQWEPADAILNPQVGRRYIQNNTGLALVKSATADLYMLALTGTQTPVSYITVPNKTIPIDTNLIDFQINPRYVKNGTLDGKVGLVNDPSYPNANDERGSYFKPLEAYATKRRIERQEQQLASYYAQFDVDRYRTINSLASLKERLSEAGAYDFARGVNQRSIYCNYVWSAVGGLHSEEHSIANSYSETYTGASSLRFQGGFEIIADIGTPFGGYYVEADAMLGNAWTMTATRAEARSNGFELSCTVTPTEFLPAPIIEQEADGQITFKGYGPNPAPGKVDSYRFMSFLLAPAPENFAALSQVVDSNWLVNSTSASANAMREALAAPSEPWRLFYRTTFVSRVPAAFQPVKDETTAPTVDPPPNLPSNDWLIRIIDAQLGTANPTPLEIGTAIDAVLGTPGQPPGLLAGLIPWWSDFYAAAQVYGTPDFRELAELREDLLQYMISKYEAEAYALGQYYPTSRGG